MTNDQREILKLLIRLMQLMNRACEQDQGFADGLADSGVFGMDLMEGVSEILDWIDRADHFTHGQRGGMSQ